MDKKVIIGRNIKHFREAFKMTQENIAKYLGLGSHSIISSWENGSRKISVDYLKKIADLFGINMIDLMDETPGASIINSSLSFRCKDFSEKNYKQIASFMRIIKNYHKMKSLANE